MRMLSRTRTRGSIAADNSGIAAISSKLGHTRRKAVAVDCTDLEAVEPHRLRMVFTLSNALPEAVVNPADLVLSPNGT